MALPENVQSVVDEIGWWEPEQEGMKEVVDRARMGGQCMACMAELGANTIVTFDASGVLTMFCTTPCLQDFHNIQFLQQIYDEIAGQIRMRSMGQAADEPEEDDEKPPDS